MKAAERAEIHLYDEGDQQILHFQPPLMGLQNQQSFVTRVLWHGGRVAEVRPDEAVIRPPIPRDRLEYFGQAMVDLAEFSGYAKQVAFLEKTEELEGPLPDNVVYLQPR